MFNIDPSPTFKTAVQISVPGGEQLPLKVVFRHKTKSELQAWMQDDKQADIDMAMEIVESVPEKGEGETLKSFFERLFEAYPAAALDLYFTYRRELTQSRIKN